MTYADGRVYEGRWKDDLWEDTNGTLRWPGGEKEYKGEFRGGKMEGVGCMTWHKPYFKMYSGSWKNSKFHGRGTLSDVHASPEVQDGYFVEDQFMGVDIPDGLN